MKVALISDVHANIYALESVYADLREESVDKILMLGDLVGYYYWPKEVIGLLRSDDRVTCIRGNHESILSEFMLSSTAAEFYRKRYGSGYDVCLEALSAEEIAWLVSLPEIHEIDILGHTFHLSHGDLGSIDQYLYPDACRSKIEQNYSKCEFTIFGHTHYPFLHAKGNQFIINPGSVGQPRDNGGLASYVILNLENQAIRFKRKVFDTDKVKEASKTQDPQLEYLWKIMSR